MVPDKIKIIIITTFKNNWIAVHKRLFIPKGSTVLAF